MTGHVNLRNVLFLLGILITSVGLIYFATEFIDRLSEWGRFLSLVLLSILFASLGMHFDEAADGAAISERRGWRWLRVTTALHSLAVVSGVVAIIVFLSMDDVDRLVKVIATIVAGLVLILVAGSKLGAK